MRIFAFICFFNLVLTMAYSGHIPSIEEYKAFYDNGFVTTALSICKEAPEYSQITKDHSKLSIKDTQYTHKEFNVVSLLQKKKADLVFILPGIFANTSSLRAREVADIYYQKGFHVFVFPSPVATDFQKAQSHFPMISPLLESKLFYKTMKNIVFDHIHLIKNVEFLSISYGAFLSSIINTLNAEDSKRNFQFKRVLALAPPHNIKNTFDILDNYINESKFKFNLIGIYRIYKTQRSLCSSSKNLEYITNNLDPIKDLVTTVGFKMGLRKSLNAYLKNQKVRVPKNINTTLFFNKYLQKYNPKGLKWLNSENSNILYWVNRAKQSQQDNFIILTSYDDFVNEKNIWPESNNIKILNGGGHYGFSNNKWFKTFLKSYILSYSL